MAKWLALLFVLIDGFATFAAEPAHEGGWGSVSGKVIFEGDLKDPRLKKYQKDLSRQGVTIPNESLPIDPKTRGVKNVFVYLTAKPERVHPSLDDKKLKPLEVSYRNHAFIPRELIIRVGQTVRMTSPMPSSFAELGGYPMDSAMPRYAVTPNQPGEWTPRVAERVPFRVANYADQETDCYWLIVDHPYAVITKADGSFQLDNLPAGNHELRIWQEIVGPVETKLPVTIRAGKMTELPPMKITVEKLSVKR